MSACSLVFASGSEQISSQGINWKGFAAADIGSLPIISGAFLAFYAFIGFEDMVNMAEEVKNPRRNTCIAIFTALIITTLLYATVAIVALSIVPLEQLSSSEAPLALVVEQGGLFSPGVMAFIGIVAILNGAMIQMIMASRVLYGMANNALIPKLLGYVSPRTRTPTIATILVGILVATFALWFPLVTLAQATSSLVLLVFILVNLSLAAINWRERRWFRLTIPLTGSILCATFAGLQLLN
ncbi:MAG: amino acid permease [Porticoccaceae bacterium]